MKKILMATFVGLLMGAFGLAPAYAQSAPSLRGDHSLDADAKMFSKKRVLNQSGGFKRSWKLQPPSIPHEIGKERINLEENSCMRCHSAENFEKEKTKKVADSHFLDAQGKKSDKLNGRRYFCTLCHTTQVDAAPLVENTFAGQ